MLMVQCQHDSSPVLSNLFIFSMSLGTFKKPERGRVLPLGESLEMVVGKVFLFWCGGGVHFECGKFGTATCTFHRMKHTLWSCVVRFMHLNGCQEFRL